VSRPDKPDHARGWRYVERLLEDERIEGLSDDELRAELGQGRTNAETEWSVDELLARAEAEAGKKPPARPGEAAPKQVEPAAKAVVAVLPEPRPRGLVWLIAAALAVALVVALMKGPEIVAQFRGDNDDRDQTPGPADREAAEKLRDDALGSCQQNAFGACKAKLDEAKRLDPGGESEPRVQKARAAIEKALRLGPETPNQPSP
jgi:hypothetical protein